MNVLHMPRRHIELTGKMTGSKLNRLRAAVLGANDGIVSVSAVVVGVAGAENSTRFILTAGIAALVAGALSMAVGEYVSVSSERDTEKALLIKENFEIKNYPKEELAELIHIYEKKGLRHSTAQMVAQELTTHDTITAHAEAELGIDPYHLTSPLTAAYASALAFMCGAIVPILMIIIAPHSMRIPLTFISVFCVLVVIGVLSAKIGGANKKTATIRVVCGGLLAMIVTFGIGRIFGVSGI